VKNNFESLRTLCEQYKENPSAIKETVGEAFKTGKLKESDVSFRALAEAAVGPNWAEELVHYQETGRTLSEAVDVTAFNGITGQIYFNSTMDGWNTAPQELSAIVKTIPTKLSGEKIPGQGLSSRYGYDLNPQEAFPEDTFGRHWIETGRSAKSGKIISLDFESVYFDKVGFVLDSARDVGRMLRESKELRIAACMAGVTITLDGKSFNGNTWKWTKPNETSATAYNTYQTTATGAGINQKTSVTFADETNIEDLRLLAVAMTHPDTGQPMTVSQELDTVISNPWLDMKMRKVLGATQVRETTNSSNRNTYSEAGVSVYPYKLVTSIHYYNALINSGISAANAQNYFQLCNPEKAFVYMENMPLTIQEQPAFGDAAFQNDLVWRGRAKEMGQAAVRSPWHTYQSKNS
jgi:hypothetical protein